MRPRLLGLMLVPGLALAALLLAAPATAASITFDLDVEFSGATPPEGGTPWMQITIDDATDTGGANGVRVTISNVGLVDAEAVTGIYLNFDPALNPTLLTFVAINTAASTPNSIQTGVNAFTADGDGSFDILFDMPPPPGNPGSRFTALESIVFDLIYTSPISASSFDFLSEPSGPQGSFKAAAHVQGIGPTNAGSGWIGAPEPLTSWLLVVGLAGLAFAGRRRS